MLDDCIFTSPIAVHEVVDSAKEAVEDVIEKLPVLKVVPSNVNTLPVFSDNVPFPVYEDPDPNETVEF